MTSDSDTPREPYCLCRRIIDQTTEELIAGNADDAETVRDAVYACILTRACPQAENVDSALSRIEETFGLNGRRGAGRDLAPTDRLLLEWSKRR